MTQENQANQKPINFRDGAIQVSVWTRVGKNGPFYEIERTRSYKDGNDQWQKTPLLSERDFLKARRLEDKAYDTIQQLKERDRALQGIQRENNGQDAPAPGQTGPTNLAQARDEAMAHVPEPQPEPSREPTLDR